MKLQLNKKKLKNLSRDTQILPTDMTPNIAGGIDTWNCTASCECEVATDVTASCECVPTLNAGCTPAPTLDQTCNPATI